MRGNGLKISSNSYVNSASHLSTALLLTALAIRLSAHELERRLQVAQAQHLLLLRRVSE